MEEKSQKQRQHAEAPSKRQEHRRYMPDQGGKLVESYLKIVLIGGEQHPVVRFFFARHGLAMKKNM